MKIEPVSDSRIKAVLSCYDILELNFDVGSLSSENKEAKQFIKEILENAHEQYGFNAHADEVKIEAVPTAKDGYVIYITKKSLGKKKESSPVVFSFSDYSEVKTAVNAIYDVFFGRSDLFELDSKYYLILDSVLGENFQKAETKLSDFGDKAINPTVFETVLNEYGKSLYKKNAINMIKNPKNR